MNYTYVLISEKDIKYYIGWTKNLGTRIVQHNKGEVRSTKYRRPMNLVYYEACLNEEDAKQREKYLKSGIGHRWLNTRLKKWRVTGFQALRRLLEPPITKTKKIGF